ncbi:MAG: helix-turn-helix transcriptional regulator [Bacillota bacterium]
MNDRYQTKFARIMGVARAIKEQEAVNRKELSRLCGGVAEETISRYIRILRDVLGYPIVFDQEIGYHFYREDYTSLNDNFNREEIILLLMALDSLTNFGGSKIFNLQNKLLSLIANAADDIKEMREKLSLSNVQEGKGNLYYINQINQAILKEKQIIFEYAPAYLEQDTMECQAVPYGVAWQHDKCYLIAYDNSDQKIINYRLDRIKKLKISSEDGYMAEDFDLQEYVSQSWKMFFGAAKEVLLKFSKSLLPLIKDKFDDDSYKIVEQTKEKFTLKSTIRGIDGLKIWLLSLGADVEVIKPQSLREEMREEAAEMLGIYD